MIASSSYSERSEEIRRRCGSFCKMPNLLQEALNLLLSKQLPAKNKQNKEKISLTPKRIAIHEAGHAIVAYYATSVIEIVKITASTYAGEVIYNSLPDCHFSNLIIALAGIASEVQILNNFRSIYSEKDLLEAKFLSEKINKNSLEDKKFSIFNFEIPNFQNFFSSSLSEKEILILNKSFAYTRNLVFSHEEEIKDLAKILLKKKILTGSDLEKILGSRNSIKVLGSFKPNYFY